MLALAVVYRAIAYVLGADDPAVASARVATYGTVVVAFIAATASVITNRRLGHPDESLARKVQRIEHERRQDRELLYLIARTVGVPLRSFERRRQESDEREGYE